MLDLQVYLHLLSDQIQGIKMSFYKVDVTLASSSERWLFESQGELGFCTIISSEDASFSKSYLFVLNNLRLGGL